MALVDEHLSLEELKKYNQAVPRYTSYPTAPQWGKDPIDYEKYLEKIGGEKVDGQASPLSLYVHIPFCARMCLFCGCSVVLNRKEDVRERYLDYLEREIEKVAAALGSRQRVHQLHFGGGTPTQLTVEQLGRMMGILDRHFEIDYQKEVAMEIDPRTVGVDGGEKLRYLRERGFTRVSFGVQDTNEKVQEAVRRRQSKALSRDTFFQAKDLGFEEINLDLIYGLPFQTLATFKETCEEIVSWRPDRVALFSYAKVPWLKPHQKAIKEESLPSVEEKLALYLHARERFLEAGYIAIGMDHFALPHTALAKAYFSKSLQRNFQGYSLNFSEHLIGLGMSSTGFVGGAYFQNEKELEPYYQALDAGQFPILKAKQLSDEDKRRKWVIGRLMCQLALSVEDYKEQFGRSFWQDFGEERQDLQRLSQEELVAVSEGGIEVLEKGKIFIRHVVVCFDAYLRKEKQAQQFSEGFSQRFSRGI